MDWNFKKLNFMRYMTFVARWSVYGSEQSAEEGVFFCFFFKLTN